MKRAKTYKVEKCDCCKIYFLGSYFCPQHCGCEGRTVEVNKEIYDECHKGRILKCPK